MKLTHTLTALLISMGITAYAAPVHLVMVVDTTHKNLKPLLLDGVYSTLKAMDSLRGARLTVIRVCGGVNTLYSAPYNRNAKQTFQALVPDLTPCKTRASDLNQGLLQARQVMARYNVPTTLFVFTDGGLSDDPQKQDFAATVGSLKTLPQLKHVALVGLEDFKNLRASFLQFFQPLQSKVIDSNLLDYPGNLQVLIRALRKGE